MGVRTFAHRKPFGAASNNAHTTMYDTPADSSRSSSSAFCEPSKPTLPPPQHPVSVAVWPSLLSSPPFPLLSASTALIHRHREGCSAARTREHRPSDFQPRRATLSSLFSRFCIHPDTPFTPLDAPTHPFVSSQDSSRGPEPRRIRSCLDASRILRLSCPNIKPLFAPCSASPVPRIIIE